MALFGALLCLYTYDAFIKTLILG